jgi:hypothetical protein
MPIDTVPPPTVKGATESKPAAAAAVPAAAPAAPTAAELPVAATTAPEVTKGSLPFTGLDVGIVAGIAMLLLGLGFALRKGVRTDS